MFPLPGRFLAAVFDLDGLLVDSEPLWGRAEAEVVASHGGVVTAADRLATVGRSIDTSLEIYASRLGLEPSRVGSMRRALVDRIRDLYRTEGVIRPGAAALVERMAARLPIGLASNSDRDLVDVALERIALAGRFSTIVTAADVGRPKPAPDVYLAACHQLGVEPRDVIGFEDSPAGISALTAAGMTAIGVRAGGAFALESADVSVDSLEEVLDWFDDP
jgi:HAD superfamily hydrolase (TIGR01509 family)